MNLRTFIVQGEQLAALPFQECPLWAQVGGLVVASATILIVAWRLSGRLRQIKHHNTTFHFGEPGNPGRTE